GVPLHINGRISGGIIVQNTHKIDAFSEKDLKLMGFIASQIGISILGRHNEERLIHSKEKAEESDRLKSAFLANMSHEIRTPMNSILGFSDLLSHYPMDKEQKKYITHIKESGVLLLNLINDIIDLSKIEAGQLSLNIQTFSVKKLLEDLFVSFDEHIKRSEKTRLRIVLATIEQDYFIQSDLLRLKQILSNFISNAIKYSKKGIITIGVEKSNKNIFRFYVKDTGIGIPSNKLDSIFERFHKIDNTEILGGGTGLGLSICKSLAEGLKGNINVKSELGIGSVFSIDLPYVQSSTTQHEIIADKNTLLSDFSNKTILIVEDDESSYFYFASTLKTTGANIIWVMDGFKAIEICKNNFSVDLILMDIRLPKLSGYAATKEIKAMHPNLPIIAQTAYAMPGEKQKCFDAGCDDYLTKPILPNDLIMSIAGFIGKNERK
ncbi:MAG: ATP-binding protein, partial [Bacteroidota bacterium]|nr:ATP-binding protein [Bacteroidota bacterium]